MLQPEQIITRAMGVRIPPRRTEKESMAIEQEMLAIAKISSCRDTFSAALHPCQERVRGYSPK